MKPYLPIVNRASASVIVIEPSSSIRMLINEKLKGQGFQNLQPMGSVEECIRHLESERVDLIFCNASFDQKVNGIHLLRVISSQPNLSTLTVFLTSQDVDLKVILGAYELGLLAFIKTEFNKDALGGAFGKLFNLFSKCKNEPLRVSHLYLREILLSEKYFTSLYALDKILVQLYPGVPELLFDLAESANLKGDCIQARSYAQLVEMLSLDLKDQVKELCLRIQANLTGDSRAEATAAVPPSTDASPADPLASVAPQAAESAPAAESAESAPAEPVENLLGVNFAVIVDPDADVIRAMTVLLEGLGIPKILSFEKGRDAETWLYEQKEEPGLIIHEWRLPGCSGAVFLQEIRDRGFHNTCIIILSSLLAKADKPLLKEMGVFDIIEKPFDKTMAIQAIIGSVNSARRPKNLAISAVKSGEDNLQALDLLGKCFMKLQDFTSALRCFERANEMCPINIERISNIVTSNLEVGDIQKAEDVLNAAPKAIQESPTIQALQSSVAIEKGPPAKPKNILKADSDRKVVSLLNSRAVSLARTGKDAESKAIYQKALEALPADWQEARAALTYNMALNAARKGDLDDCLKILNDHKIPVKGELYKKISSLQKRVQAAKEKGVPLELNQEQCPDAKKAESAAPEVAEWEVKIAHQKGDLCCFKVFRWMEESSQAVLEKFGEPPAFTLKVDAAKLKKSA